MITDLYAPILLDKKNDTNNFSDIIRTYYTSNQYKNRTAEFIALTFEEPNLKNRKDFREYLFSVELLDNYLKNLEIARSVRDKIDHRVAAVYAFADYLYDNFCGKGFFLSNNKCHRIVKYCSKYNLDGS